MPTKTDINDFYQILFGYRLSQCLYVAAKLGIADFLAKEALPIATLAHLVKVDSEALYRVLRCLAAHGIFHENNQGLFELTPKAELLISTNAYNVCNSTLLCGEEFYQSMGHLLYSVKTGEPAFDREHGQDFWHYLEQTPNTAKTFNDAMEKGSLNSVDALLDAYDFSAFSTIVDVGGGKGHLLAAILQKNMQATGVVFDLPCVIAQAAQYIKAFGFEDRCQLSEGDFFKDRIPKGDALLLKVILHDWNDEKALVLLSACRAQLAGNNRLIIIEKIIAENHYLPNILLGDVHMLATHGGKERSLIEFKGLLRQAGFEVLQVISTQSAFSIIEAIPV